MDIETLVAAASESSLTSAELRGAADVLGCTVEEVSNRVAWEVAQRFLDGRIPWEIGDAAMNHLYELAYGRDELCLGDLAWRVYLAFDEGEYIHAGEDPELDGEPRTRKILTSMMADGGDSRERRPCEKDRKKEADAQQGDCREARGG